MNNIDPFNLRSFNAPSIFRQGANIAANAANNIRAQIEEGAKQLQGIERPAESRASPSREDMSYAVSSDRQDDTSDGAPQARRVYSDNPGGNVVSEKIGNMFRQNQEELPMYKDKPYNYASSKRHLPLWRRQRLLSSILAFSSLLVLYYFGFIPGLSSDSTLTSLSSSKTASGLFGGKPSAKWEQRRERVKDVFIESWDAYEKHAWGYDEYHPVSERGRQMVPGGMGWIIVDALDTMILMNLTTQLSHAREWMTTSLTYDKDHDVNTFETTIRMLGGLLSAQYLSTSFPELAPVPVKEGSSAEDLYMEKAADLAERLLGAYESPSGIPYASVNLSSRKGIPSHDDGGASSTAEAATLQLEMKYVAKLTGEKAFWDASEYIIKVIDNNGAQDGLVPIYVAPDTGNFRGVNVRLGSRGDSYYEYLIKQYLQTSEQEPVYLEMWDEAMRGVRKHLLAYSQHSKLTVLGERPNGLDQSLLPKMDHLVCFMPGTIALGATKGLRLAEAKKQKWWGKQQEADMDLARELMKTCWGMYKKTKTGLAPEITHFIIDDPPHMVDGTKSSPPTLRDEITADWRLDYDIHGQDYHNLQRPETVESLFYMWRITGDVTYREWGWQMFESFVKHTKVSHPESTKEKGAAGYSSINNCDSIPITFRDNMESFWLAETLKYMYLLFGPDDVLPLDKVVFNTEAHPFPKFELGKLFSTGWKRKPRDAQGNIIQTKEEAKGEHVVNLVKSNENGDHES